MTEVGFNLFLYFKCNLKMRLSLSLCVCAHFGHVRLYAQITTHDQVLFLLFLCSNGLKSLECVHCQE